MGAEKQLLRKKEYLNDTCFLWIDQIRRRGFVILYFMNIFNRKLNRGLINSVK